MRRTSLTIVCAALACAACGDQRQAPSAAPSTSVRAAQASVPHAHPQAIEPVAGATAATAYPAGPVVQVSVGPPTPGLARPASDAEIRRELAASGLSGKPSRATLTASGLAIPPLGAPPVVQEIIQAGNLIARLPYRYGGGHVTFLDTAYDCSGSISFAFEAAHLLSGPVVSGDLMNWGGLGPGRWITIFANAGHTFMYVAGLRFDTVALAQTGSRWSNLPATEDLASFAVRHPVGL